MNRRTHFNGSRSRKPAIQHRYVRRINRCLENHSSWGIRLEVLFRGFSPADMFRIEGKIRDLIAREKQAAFDTGELKEVVLHNLVTKPFKDEVIFDG